MEKLGYKDGEMCERWKSGGGLVCDMTVKNMNTIGRMK